MSKLNLSSCLIWYFSRIFFAVKQQRNHINIILFACLFALSGLTAGLGQTFMPGDYTYSVETWSDADGLPLSTAYQIVSSSDGYLWFATEGGLVRYDGARFFTYDRANNEKITSNHFTAVAAGADGGIIAVNNNQFVRVYKGIVTVYPLTGINGDADIRAVAETRDARILAGIYNQGIYTLDKNGNDSFLKTADGLPSLNIKTLHRDKLGQVWIGTDKGAAIYRNGQVEPFSIFGENPIQFITTDSNNYVWFGTQTMGVFQWAENILTQITTGAGLSSNDVISITEDADGAIWIGTREHGLNKMVGSDITQFTSAHDLPAGQIKSLGTDISGTVWAGSLRNGVAQLKKRTVHTLATEHGLSSRFIQAIFQQKNGIRWVGTLSSGIMRISENEITTFTDQDGLPHNRIQSIYETPDEVIWVGTPTGLSRFENERFTTIARNEEFAGTSIRTLFAGDDDILWIGSDGKGLFKYEDGEIARQPLNQLLDHSTILSLFKDSKGRLWIGTQGSGIAILENNDLTHYGGDANVPNYHIHAFHEDSRGIIWIGTGSGLLRFEDYDFEIFTSSLGLQYNEFYTLFEDKNRNLWSTSNQGLQLFSLDELELVRQMEQDKLNTKVIGLSEGLPTRQFNSGISPAGWKMNDGNIWLPTMRGIVLVNPEQSVRKATPVHAFIERLIAGDDEFITAEKVFLEPGTRTLEIEYTAPEFYSPGRVRFRYRLLGFDDIWVEAGTRRTAYYSGLNPGNYTFEVQASHEGEAWIGTTGTLAFKINPYFYQSNWFLLLISLGLFIVAYSSIRLRIKTIREKELTRMVESRTEELQKEIQKHKKTEKQLQVSLNEKIVLLKEMHHRVKNNLTLIYALFELQMSKIDDNQLSDVLRDSQNRLKSMAMLHEQLYQSELLSNIRFNDFAKQMAQSIIYSSTRPDRNIDLEFDLDEVELDIGQAVPSGLILNELVTNAYKHAFNGRNKGKISIGLNYNHPHVSITVSDNGVGLDKNFVPEESSSLGLELVFTLANQLNGNVQYSSDNGTLFKVSFEKDE